MVAVQVALSVVLLSGSVLVLRGLQNALTVRLGFEPRGAAVVAFDLSLQGGGRWQSTRRWRCARSRDLQV